MMALEARQCIDLNTDTQEKEIDKMQRLRSLIY